MAMLCMEVSLVAFLEKLDISSYTAPQIDLEQDMVRHFIQPMLQIGRRIYRQSSSKSFRFLVKDRSLLLKAFMYVNNAFFMGLFFLIAGFFAQKCYLCLRYKL